MVADADGQYRQNKIEADVYLEQQQLLAKAIQAEGIAEAKGIQEELDAYNPLIPDGRNWKATFMLEYEDPQQRKDALERLAGIEDRVWLRVDSGARIYAIADEDMDRERGQKTAAVHFLRFELPPEAIRALKRGATVTAGIDLPAYQVAEVRFPAEVVASLCADLESVDAEAAGDSA